jgi:hypothetical protein
MRHGSGKGFKICLDAGVAQLFSKANRSQLKTGGQRPPLN